MAEPTGEPRVAEQTARPRIEWPDGTAVELVELDGWRRDDGERLQVRDVVDAARNLHDYIVERSREAADAWKAEAYELVEDAGKPAVDAGPAGERAAELIRAADRLGGEVWEVSGGFLGGG